MSKKKGKRYGRFQDMSAPKNVVSLTNSLEHDRNSKVLPEGKAGQLPHFFCAQESAKSSSQPGRNQERVGFRIGMSLEECMSKHSYGEMWSLANVTNKICNLSFFLEGNAPLDLSSGSRILPTLQVVTESVLYRTH